MKKFESSPDYFCVLTSACGQPRDERSPKSVYSREFQAMLDRLEEEDCAEESVLSMAASEKKRRLSLHQVQALEKSFEVEKKLDPGKKAKLARELGLEPRQVAVWFQNRRARWKTKQLERDFALLKADYESLRADFDEREREKAALNAEIRELRGRKLRGENAAATFSVEKQSPPFSDAGGIENNNDALEQSKIRGGSKELEDGPSDTDSGGNSEGGRKNLGAQLLTSPAASSSSSSSTSQMVSPRPIHRIEASNRQEIPETGFQSQLAGMEEQGVFYCNAEEGSCDFLSVDQAPTLLWG